MITMPRMITGQPCSCKIHAINYFQYVICSRPAPIGTTIKPDLSIKGSIAPYNLHFWKSTKNNILDCHYYQLKNLLLYYNLMEGI